MQFGKYLKELREKRNLLQRELAAAVNMDVAYLSKIETGNRTARKEQVIAFAKALHLKNEDLLKIWTANKITELLKDEQNSSEILKIAEEEIKYSKNKASKKNDNKG